MDEYAVLIGLGESDDEEPHCNEVGAPMLSAAAPVFIYKGPPVVASTQLDVATVASATLPDLAPVIAHMSSASSAAVPSGVSAASAKSVASAVTAVPFSTSAAVGQPASEKRGLCMPHTCHDFRGFTEFIFTCFQFSFPLTYFKMAL